MNVLGLLSLGVVFAKVCGVIGVLLSPQFNERAVGFAPRCCAVYEDLEPRKWCHVGKKKEPKGCGT